MSLVCLLYTLAVLCGMFHGEAQLRSLGLLSNMSRSSKTLVFKSLPADNNLMLGTC